MMAPFPGTYAWLYFQKQHIKKEAKRQLTAGVEKSELVLLQLSVRDAETKLRWEHSREFEYQGRMYDVVEKRFKNDSVYYWCWWDHAETELNRKLDRLVAGVWEKNPQHHEKERQLVRFLETLYFIEMPDWSIATYPERDAALPFCRAPYTSYTSAPNAPPPKLV